MLNKLQVKSKIEDYINKLNAETDKEKRRNLQKRISYYWHYFVNREKEKVRQKVHKKNKKIRNYTQIDMEIAECQNRENPIRFEPNKNTKTVMGEHQVIRKCCKCKKKIREQYSYSTIRQIEQNKFYCDKCKDETMIKVYI